MHCQTVISLYEVDPTESLLVLLLHFDHCSSLNLSFLRPFQVRGTLVACSMRVQQLACDIWHWRLLRQELGAVARCFEVSLVKTGALARISTANFDGRACFFSTLPTGKPLSSSSLACNRPRDLPTTNHGDGSTVAKERGSYLVRAINVQSP